MSGTAIMEKVMEGMRRIEAPATGFRFAALDMQVAMAGASPAGAVLAEYLTWWKESLSFPTELRRIKHLPGETPKRIQEIQVNLGLRPRECWRNAAQLALALDGCLFVEGAVDGPLGPIHHAWNRIDGIDFDVTYEAAAEKDGDPRAESLLGSASQRMGLAPLAGDEVSAALDAMMRRRNPTWRNLSPHTYLKKIKRLSDERAWRLLHHFPMS